MSQEIYEVTIRGNEAALQALTQLDTRAKQASEQFTAGAKDGAAHADNWTSKVSRLADGFKAVSRDVDTVGGSFAATFAKGTDDVLSMVTAIGSGGLLGGVAVLTTAIGLLYSRWQEEQAKTKAAIERSTQQLADQDAMHDDLAKRILAKGRELTEEDKNNARASGEAYKKELAIAQAQYETVRRVRGKTFEEMLTQNQLEAQMALRVGDLVVKQKMDEAQVLAYRKQRVEAMRQEAELMRIDAENARILAREEARRTGDAERRANDTQNRANDVGNSSAAFVGGLFIGGISSALASMRAAAAAEQNAALERQAELRRMVTVSIDDENAKWKELTDLMNENTDAVRTGSQASAARVLQDEYSTAQQKANAIRAIAEVDNAREVDRSKQFQEELKLQVLLGQRTQEWADALMASDDKLSATRISNRQAETEATIRALERQQQAEQRMMAQQVYGTGVNAAYGASMYYVGQSIDFVSGQAQKFGSINRDNWRDMLAITEDTKAAFAAQLQAFLFNMGIQSGKMAVFEMAEASKEGALMAGSIAVYDFAGAANHGISAAAHLATSGLYATLGTGAVGGSLAIGAARGSGGMFKAVPDNPVTGSSTSSSGGGPSSSGGPAGGGGNTWNSPSVININNNYGGGGINAQDDRRAAQAVARGVQRANQSYVMRRQMQRAT